MEKSFFAFVCAVHFRFLDCVRSGSSYFSCVLLVAWGPTVSTCAAIFFRCLFSSATEAGSNFRFSFPLPNFLLPRFMSTITSQIWCPMRWDSFWSGFLHEICSWFYHLCQIFLCRASFFGSRSSTASRSHSPVLRWVLVCWLFSRSQVRSADQFFARAPVSEDFCLSFLSSLVFATQDSFILARLWQTAPLLWFESPGSRCHLLRHVFVCALGFRLLPIGSCGV
jgi:hypothetical protein